MSAVPLSSQSNVSQCPEPFARWYCLNGATCFSLLIDQSVLYNCWCQNGYHGPRCDFKHARPNFKPRDSDDEKPTSSDVDTTTNDSAEKIEQNAGFITVPDGVSSLVRPVGARHGFSSHSKLERNPQALKTFVCSCLIVLVVLVVIILVIR